MLHWVSGRWFLKESFPFLDAFYEPLGGLHGGAIAVFCLKTLCRENVGARFRNPFLALSLGFGIWDLPEGSNILPSTWTFKIKRYPDGRLRKFKARFCFWGDKQIEGIDNKDKFVPVDSCTDVRILM